ncbi:hypothetical protein NN561_006427 [Cricetulus griseus]
MDVTSLLNLEREAGMGENTERQPVEPESLCVWQYLSVAEPEPEVPRAPLPIPGEDKPLPRFCPRQLPASPVFPPRSQTSQALAITFSEEGDLRWEPSPWLRLGVGLVFSSKSSAASAWRQRPWEIRRPAGLANVCPRTGRGPLAPPRAHSPPPVITTRWEPRGFGARSQQS